MSNKNTPNSTLFQQYEREYKRIQQAIRRQIKLGYAVPEELKPIPPTKVEKVTAKDVERLIKLTPQAIRKKSTYVDPHTGEVFEGLDIVKSHHKAKPSTAKVKERKPRKPKQIQQPTESKRKRKRKGEEGQEKQTKRKKKQKQTEPEYAPPKENTLNMQIIDTINQLLAEFDAAPYWRGSFLERKYSNYHKISALWQETLATEGEYEVAFRLENNATEFIRLVERLLYASDSTIEDDFNMSRFVELLIGRALTAYESDHYTEIAREAAMDALRGENSIG